jgi:hypothetical protein
MARTPLRWLTYTALTVFVTAQLGALTHLVLVPHVRCEAHGAIEHGSLEHGDGDHGHAAQHGDAVHTDAVHTDAAHTDAVRADADAHGHDGCALLALRPVATLPSLEAPSRPLAPVHARARARAPDAPLLACRALDHAPKTSPPA